MRDVFIISGAHLCLIGLVFSLVIYGAFGSPTPDSFGMVEALIGVGLLVAVGVRGALGIFEFGGEEPRWLGLGRALLLFGLSVPLVVGAMSGHGIGLIARDVTAFMFMALPVLMAGFVREYPDALRPLLWAGVFVGSAFSLRVMWGSDSLYYLGNSPLVLMAAIYCCGRAVQVFIERFSVRSLGRVGVFMMLGALALYPLVEAQQRASLGAFVVAMGLICVSLCMDHPRRMVFILVAVAVGGLMFWADLYDVWDLMRRKSDLVGFNQRFEEWAAVWGVVGDHPLRALFGAGWGAQVSSPAVADIRVLYTHGLFGSMLLKAGLVGLGLCALYIGTLLCALLRLGRGHIVLILALSMPIVIDALLYASFKSLDFGVVLLIATSFFRGQVRVDD